MTIPLLILIAALQVGCSQVTVNVNGGGRLDAAGILIIAGLPARNYADDSAAAAGGVPVGGLYNTAGTVKVRMG